MTVTCDLSCSPNCKVSFFRKQITFNILQLLVIAIRDAKGCKVSETFLNFWKIAENVDLFCCFATLITIRDEFLNIIFLDSIFASCREFLRGRGSNEKRGNMRKKIYIGQNIGYITIYARSHL